MMANKSKAELGIIEGPIRWAAGATSRSLRMNGREWDVTLADQPRHGMVCHLEETVPPGTPLDGPVVLSRAERAALVACATSLFRATLERQWRTLYPEHY